MENLVSLFLVFISFFLILSIKKWKRSKTKTSTPCLPPGPWKLPLIGNLHQLVGFLPHRRLADLAKTYGPIMYLQLGQLPIVVISSPEAAIQVMKTHDIIFASRPFNLSASIIAYNRRDIAFSPYCEYWRELRKICTLELLSAKRVHQYRPIREEVTSELVGLLSSTAGSPVNLSKMLESASGCITLRTAFGKVEKLEDAHTPVVQEILAVLGGFRIADVFPSIKLLQVITGMRSKLQKLHQEVDIILENIVEEHRKIREEKRLFGSEVIEDDLVHVLLNLQDSNKLQFPLTTQDIKAVILDIILGGYDTTATTVEWAMSEMLKQPRIMQKAQAEVRQVYNQKGKVDETNIHELKYLKLVIKETLRVHPPGPLLIPREARETMETCGYQIPIKTQVIVNACAIGNDPRYWKEAEKFYPERFLDRSTDYKGTDFELIPFGSGRRMCAGMAFGVSVVELLLASLLYHFDWKDPDGVTPEDLDMSETFGLAVRRKNALRLIPFPYNHLPENQN